MAWGSAARGAAALASGGGAGPEALGGGVRGSASLPRGAVRVHVRPGAWLRDGVHSSGESGAEGPGQPGGRARGHLAFVAEQRLEVLERA